MYLTVKTIDYKNIYITKRGNSQGSAFGLAPPPPPPNRKPQLGLRPCSTFFCMSVVTLDVFFCVCLAFVSSLPSPIVQSSL